MKAIIVIEIDEKHLLKEMNELYDRLNGYKCDLKPMPEKFTTSTEPYICNNDWQNGWNDCLEEIEK